MTCANTVNTFYDPNFILQHARLIVDTRDFFAADTLEAAGKLHKA